MVNRSISDLTVVLPPTRRGPRDFRGNGPQEPQAGPPPFPRLTEDSVEQTVGPSMQPLGPEVKGFCVVVIVNCACRISRL